jgi:hypothetical protein
LKRLSDAQLVERFQFHRRDGGGVPMCYVISELGLLALETAGRIDAQTRALIGAESAGVASRADSARRLRQARHDVHVAGWTLSLVRMNGELAVTPRGPQLSVLTPPTRPSPTGRTTIGPGDLRLPGGRVPHDFLRRAEDESFEVERFATIRPDAIVELAASHAQPSAPADRGRRDSSESGARLAASGRALDVIVELDDRLATRPGVAKLERYDHFLAGWAVHTQRYGQRCEAEPLVVFVCRDRPARRLPTRP